MNTRIRITRGIIWTLFAVIAIYLVYVQMIRGQYYYRLSTHNRIRIVPTQAPRGRILDRNGVVIADNRISFDVMITPQEIKGKDKLFSYLSHVLGVDKKKLLKKFYRKKATPFAPVLVAEDIERDDAFILEENKFRFPSLLIQKNYRRKYPYGTVGAHVLGYVGKIDRAQIERLQDYGYSSQSVVGQDGVEEIYDLYLRGKQGGVQVEVNSRGQQVRLLGLRDPEQGKNVQLTIDNRLQLLATKALQSNSGAIVVMDVENGEILGMVSAPSFDPSSFIDSGRKKEALSLFRQAKAPMLNRAIKALCPPGSVFKIPVAFSVLNTGKVTKEEEFSCPGYFRMGRRRIRCAHVHQDQSIVQAIAHSCNVYFINVALRVESDVMAKYAKLFGLGQKTGVDLPYEKKGLIPSSRWRRSKFNRAWYKGDTANLSIGQGDVLTTPIQLTRMMAAVANDGKLVTPHVIKYIDGKDATKSFGTKRIRLKKELFKTVKEGLYGVVHDERGTARYLNMKNLEISGKTGTAQSTAGKKHHAWFVGFAPFDDKTVAFCVFLEYGESSAYAVRVARDFLEKIKRSQIL